MVTHNLGRLTVVAGQVIRFPEIWSVWRQSEQVDQLNSAVKEGCFEEKSNATREKKIKNTFTTFAYHFTIPLRNNQ